MNNRIRVGTRESALAKTQTQSIVRALQMQGLDPEVVYIESEGDQSVSQPLYAIESTPGLFTKTLERALLEGRIDLAVHSLKDLPTLQPAGLKVWAIPARENPEDVLLVRSDGYAKGGASLPLNAHARIGTSSLRREAELKSVRSDLQSVLVRGNVATRIEKLLRGDADAIVLAQAGLARLGWTAPKEITLHPLPFRSYPPAPGQGALAVEGRSDLPVQWRPAVESLTDKTATLCTQIERRILRALEGGCSLPLGVHCAPVGGGFELHAFLGVYKENQLVNAEGVGRHWERFVRFDISETNPETLVAKTLAYFQGERACP